jgi:hypothetical protein
VTLEFGGGLHLYESLRSSGTEYPCADVVSSDNKDGCRQNRRMPWKKCENDMVIITYVCTVDTVAVPNIQRELTNKLRGEASMRGQGEVWRTV